MSLRQDDRTLGRFWAGRLHRFSDKPCRKSPGYRTTRFPFHLARFLRNNTWFPVTYAHMTYWCHLVRCQGVTVQGHVSPITTLESHTLDASRVGGFLFVCKFCVFVVRPVACITFHFHVVLRVTNANSTPGHAIAACVCGRTVTRLLAAWARYPLSSSVWLHVSMSSPGFPFSSFVWLHVSFSRCVENHKSQCNTRSH